MLVRFSATTASRGGAVGVTPPNALGRRSGGHESHLEYLAVESAVLCDCRRSLPAVSQVGPL